MMSLLIAVNCFIAIKASLIGDSIKEDFEQIKQYELIYFQNTDSFVEGNDINFLEFDAFNQHFKLKLTLHDNYPSVVVHHDRSTELAPIEDHIPCHYKGEAIEPMDPTIRYISVSVCNNRGVRAFIITEDDEYVIHPALHYLDPYNEASDGHQLHNEHLIYKHSDNFPSSSELKSKSLNTNTNVNTRRRLPYDSENVIELFILVDPVYCDSFKDEYGSSRWYDEMVDYIQDFVNAGSGEYESTDFGYNSGTFSIKLVRLEVVESWSSHYRSLEFDAKRDEYDGRDGCSGFRRKFRDWAESKVDQDFDFGALWTRSSRGGGAAWKSGICSSSNHYMHSCSDGNASRQRKLLAHELGHSLGMEHDEKSECWDSQESSSSNDKKCPYICSDGNVMGDGDHNTNGFSSCSKKYLRDYMEERDGFSCLRPQSNSLEIVSDNTGSNNNNDDNSNNNNDDNSNNNDNNNNNNNNNDESCVKISSLTMNRKSLSGEWKETGTKYNRKPSYKRKKGSYYIYQCEWEGDWWWAISRERGSSDCWDYGWCGKSDLFDCDGEWEDDDGVDDNSQFYSCSALETDTVDTYECLESDSYSEAVCVYHDGMESDHVLYEVDQVWGCHYEHPVYRYVDDDGTYYLHCNSHGSWVISNDNLHNYGSHQCDDEDLFNCTVGKWSIEVTYNDLDSVEIHPTMTVESCGSNASVKSGDGAISMTIVLVMACIVIAVLIVISAGCIWKGIQKRGTYGFKGEEIPDEEDLEAEIEVEAIIDDDTNTTI